MKGISMNATVHVDLIDRWLHHLYKNRGYTLDIETTSTRVKGVKSGRYEQKFIT
jgi:hypothetical protein